MRALGVVLFVALASCEKSNAPAVSNTSAKPEQAAVAGSS